MPLSPSPARGVLETHSWMKAGTSGLYSPLGSSPIAGAGLLPPHSRLLPPRRCGQRTFGGKDGLSSSPRATLAAPGVGDGQRISVVPFHPVLRWLFFSFWLIKSKHG